jgi:tetratricopeptide (TPR) repeat protein
VVEPENVEPENLDAFSAVMRLLADGAPAARIGAGIRALPPDSLAAFRRSVVRARTMADRIRSAGPPGWLFEPREKWLLGLLDDIERSGLERALASASEPPPPGPWEEFLELALDVILAPSRRRIGELMASDARLGTQEFYDTVAHLRGTADPTENAVLEVRAGWLLWILQRGRRAGYAQALAEAPPLPGAVRCAEDEPDLFESWNRPAGPVLELLSAYDRSGDLSVLERLTAHVREMTGEASVSEAVALQQTGARWLDRYERAPEPQEFAIVVELLDGAIARFPPAHIGVAHTRHMLAGAWLRRRREEEHPEHARRAADLLARAAEELPADDRFWPECVIWLGRLLLLRSTAEGDPDVLAQAIEVLDRVRAEPRAGRDTWLTAVDLRLHALLRQLAAGTPVQDHLDDLLDTAYGAVVQVESATADADLAGRLRAIGGHCREIHRHVEHGFLRAAVAVSRTALRLSPPHQEGWRASALELSAALILSSDEEPDPARPAEALELLDVALSEDGTDRLELLQAQAAAASRMFGLTAEPEWAELALRSGRAALDLSREQGDQVPVCALTVAQQLLADHRRTGGAAELDEAIELLEEAAGLASPGERSLVFNSLGAALIRRFGARAGIGDIDAAISALETAAQAARPGTARMRDVLNNLSFVLTQRYFRTREPALLDRAVECLEEAIGRSPLPGADDAWLRARQAGILLDRFRVTGRPADLERCLELSAAVRQSGHRLHPGTRLMANNTHGNALLRRHRRGGPASDLDRAVEAFESTLPEARADTANGPRYLRDLALTYQDRYKLSGAGDDLGRGTARYRESIESGLTLDPATALDSARLLGDWAAGRGAWAEAAEAYGSGLTAVRRLVAIQSVRADKESWLRDAQMVPARAAYALVRAGRPQDAVLALENGQALLLHEALEPGAERPRADGSYDAITRAARERPLVYVAVSPWGGTALVVDGTGAVRPVPLPGLTTAALNERLLAYVEAYDARAASPATWHAAIDEVSRWLWTTLMEPLVALGHAALTLVPTGYLWLLPAHLAWRPDDGPAGRRYALDDVLLTYAPNARVLNREAGLEAHGLLMVEDATLPYAEPEARIALRRFATGDRRHLRGSEATRSRVLAALGDHACLHFACHGRANPHDPLESALRLADARLTLRDVIATRTNARLVILSACETAMTGIALPDEVVGLPVGFLQAGATGVLGSLWAVPDKSTARLMSYFYELWRDGGRPPADALREAQRRLRDELVRSGGPEAAHPAGWGAFVHVGR